MDKPKLLRPQLAVYYGEGDNRIVTYIEKEGEEADTYLVHGVEQTVHASLLTPFSRKATGSYQETNAFDALPSYVQLISTIVSKDLLHLGRLIMRGVIKPLTAEEHHKAMALADENKQLREDNDLLVFTLQQLHKTLLPLTEKDNITYLKSFALKDGDKVKFNTPKVLKEVPKMLTGGSKLIALLKSLDINHLKELDGVGLMSLGKRHGIDLSDVVNELAKMEEEHEEKRA